MGHEYSVLMGAPESVPSEHMEQVRFVSWWRKHRPERIFAIPNGGHRGKGQAQKLKAEGVSPGVPDLFVPELSLWIEMKRQKGGALSPDQKDWIEHLESIGHKVVVCKGCDHAIETTMGATIE